MSNVIPATHQDLVEKPLYATLATVMADGQPKLSLVWFSYDGQRIIVNTARGRMKEKNMSARPMATILIVDPQNPFRYLEIRGQVEEITEEGALDHIDQSAMRYVGQPKYYGGVAPAESAGQEIRVLCKIKPVKVIAFGG